MKQVLNQDELIDRFFAQDYTRGQVTGRTANKKYYLEGNVISHAHDDYVVAEVNIEGSLSIVCHPTDANVGAFQALIRLVASRRKILILVDE